ncbi:MAG: S8 family serine peptidase, partial [Solobacterium sp.]|nr:S8 family serine peptidase [Solobacterium sp.]
MKKQNWKQLITVAAACILLFSGARTGVCAEEYEVPTEPVMETSEDLSKDQYYFQNGAGAVFPGWNSYAEDGSAIPNVDPAKKSVIAVLDTGVDYTHEDLAGVMWKDGLNENYTRLKKFGGGMYGYNATGNTAEERKDPMDYTGHGTHVAGIIAAEWNHKGISGALSGVEIMAVKAISNHPDQMRNALEYVLAAKQDGVNVTAVNISWNGSVQFSFPEQYDDVITKLGESGVVTVFAAGNEASDLNENIHFSNFMRSNPYVITVAASDQKKKFASALSNYGDRYVDVMAPGVHILSTMIRNEEKGAAQGASPSPEASPSGALTAAEPSNSYAYMDGTSMAAPIVTALAGYLYNNDPAMPAEERALRIVASCERMAEANGKVYGGFISPEQAVKGALEPVAVSGSYNSVKSQLTIEGSEFGGETGKVTVDGMNAAVSLWAKTKITVKCDSLTLGEHSVAITRKDGKQSSRWIHVSGSNSEAEVLPLVSLPSMRFDTAAVIDGIAYVSGIDPEFPETSSIFANSGAKGEWNRITGKTERMSLRDVCAIDGKLYYLADSQTLMIIDPADYAGRRTVKLEPEQNAQKISLSAVQNRLFLTWNVMREKAGDPSRIVLAEFSLETEKLEKRCELESKSDNVSFMSLAETDDAIVLLTVETDKSDVLNAYSVSPDDAETAPVLLFSRTIEAGTELNYPVAAGYKGTLVFAGLETVSGGTHTAIMEEINLEGKTVRKVPIAGGHLSALSGTVSDGYLYLAGNADAWPHNRFVLRIRLSGDPVPTPTPTPTTTPTPTPTITPTPTPT